MSEATQDGTLRISPLTILQEGNGAGNNTTIPIGNDNSSCSATPEPSTTFSATEMAGVGIGVGIPLLVCIAALAVVIWKQKRRLDALKAAPEAYTIDHKVGSPAYTQSLLSHPQAPPYNNYPVHQSPPPPPPIHGHFREVQLNELDSAASPQELSTGANKRT
jgi:hypothetical protein